MEGNIYAGSQWTPKRTNGLAIASLIVSIVALFTWAGMCCGLPIVFSIAAIIMALVARSQIMKAPDIYTGKGLTTAALIIAGIQGVANAVFLIGYWTIVLISQL